MNERTKVIIQLVVFLICLVMIIMGQKNVGYTGLAIEIVGLIGILVVLFTYNRDHK